MTHHAHDEIQQIELLREDVPVSLKRLPQAILDEINLRRAKLASFYNGLAKPNPSISFGNEGTGYGKSYNVFAQFIENAHAGDAGTPHRNMMFITPQKAQIKLPEVLVNTAQERGVQILSLLSLADLTDLEFTGWVDGIGNAIRYKAWCQDIKGEYYRPAIDALRFSISNQLSLLKELEHKQRADESYSEIRRIEADVQKGKKRLNSALIDLAKAVLGEQKHGKFITLEDRLNTPPTKQQRCLIEVLDFLLPFERAKIMPTILLATSMRFLFNTYVAGVGRDGKPVVRSQRFDYTLGMKASLAQARSDEHRIRYASDKPFGEQIEFLRTGFFLPDEGSEFKRKGITFTLVIDEEHASYEIFTEAAHQRLITSEDNVSHIFAALQRLVEPIREAKESEADNILLYTPRKELADRMYKLYDTRCATTTTLSTILNMCKANVGHIVVDNSEAEHILNISKNIFSFSPKHFYSEASLKKIRIREEVNGSELLVYADRSDPGDTNPTLHDFMQALICALAACAHITDANLIGLIESGYEYSQNSLLARFISKAKTYRRFVEALFDRVDDEELLIDNFYVYVVPKLVLTLQKLPWLQFDSSTRNERVYLGFLLDLYLELPEVSVMRVLHNTRNSVLCLSATTGFQHSYCGNYSRDALARFGSSIPESLDYRLIERSPADQAVLQTLRESRAMGRSVETKVFHDTKSNQLSAHHGNEEFAKELKFWKDLLRPHYHEVNRHRYAALERQVEAMLLAAWDSKNSLILSLNNRFQSVLGRLFTENRNGRLKHFKWVHENRIFEITPFRNRATLRVILFDAGLDKEIDIDVQLNVPSNTRVAFISSYLSAGTGLNLILTDRDSNVQEDFERLVLINQPFYTAVKGEDGLNTLPNHILLLRHHAAGTPVRLADFESNLMAPKNRAVLKREHRLSILKTVIQAIGRIERRDTRIASEILLPSDLVDLLIVSYAQLRREGNDPVINGLSLLNHSVMQYCLQEAQTRAFKNNEQREAFEAMTEADGEAIEAFFSGEYRRTILAAARSGNLEAAMFNEALRDIRSVRNPRAYVQALLSQPVVKNDPYYQRVISKFYIGPEKSDCITLCTKEGCPMILTDLMYGDGLYAPQEWLIPAYLHGLANPLSPTFALMKKAWSLETEEFAQYPPHPAMIPLLKGNVGEYVFAQCLKVIGLQPLSVEAVFRTISPQAYEMYDVYLQHEETLVCVDVKNWSTTLESPEASAELIDRAAVKREKMIELCAIRGLQPRFVYVNTRHDLNELNTADEFTVGQPVHYMNLLKALNNYERVEKQKEGRGKEIRYMAFDQFAINPQLIQILEGEV